MVGYDGLTFQPSGESDPPRAHYHQDGDLVWAEFGGGRVRRGSLVGTSDADGVLRFTYCMVLRGGEVVSGRSTSVPVLLDDGRIRLTERWERYGPHAGTGVSYLEQVDGAGPPAAPSPLAPGNDLPGGRPRSDR
jgi:hypothetical protein